MQTLVKEIGTVVFKAYSWKKSGPIPFNYFLEKLHDRWNAINHNARNYLLTEKNAINYLNSSSTVE